MNADSMVAGDAAHQRLLDNLADLLRQGALPGELADFSEEDRRAAAEFIAACAARRPPGIALVRLESVGTKLGHRRMRIASPMTTCRSWSIRSPARSPRAA